MAAQAEFHLMLEALDEPALLIGGSRILAMNEAAGRLFGAAVEGTDVRLVIRHPQVLEHILRGETGDLEATGIAGPGRSWLISLRRWPGGRLLVRLSDNSALRAAEKMRVDFVANASHELRTPLTTILGYAETIADDPDLDPESSSRFGAVIRSEAKRMLRIIEDLMSLSRIEADRFVPVREQIDIGELVQEAIANAGRLADARQCAMRMDVEDALPPVPGDRARLEQLLDNLVANAIRYGCTRNQCAITVSARGRGTEVVLTVSDTGAGIPREHLPRLTERFYRVDAARSRDSGGTGLGLAIVKHIVERHRGTLEIRSTLGKGTEVEVRLPSTSGATVTKL